MPEITEVKAEIQFSAEVKLSKMDWEDLQHGGRVVLTLHVPRQNYVDTPKGKIFAPNPVAIQMGIAVSKPDVLSLVWSDLQVTDLMNPRNEFHQAVYAKFEGKQFRVYMEEVK